MACGHWGDGSRWGDGTLWCTTAFVQTTHALVQDVLTQHLSVRVQWAGGTGQFGLDAIRPFAMVRAYRPYGVYVGPDHVGLYSLSVRLQVLGQDFHLTAIRPAVAVRHATPTEGRRAVTVLEFLPPPPQGVTAAATSSTTVDLIWRP